jgi:hypothetical protein
VDLFPASHIRDEPVRKLAMSFLNAHDTILAESNLLDDRIGDAGSFRDANAPTRLQLLHWLGQVDPNYITAQLSRAGIRSWRLHALRLIGDRLLVGPAGRREHGKPQAACGR